MVLWYLLCDYYNMRLGVLNPGRLGILAACYDRGALSTTITDMAHNAWTIR